MNVTATRTPTKADRTPASISVITDQDLEEQQAQDIKEALRYEPGVTVRRASYATLEDCEADWNTPNDCESVPIDDPSTIYSSSLNAPASEAAGSGTTHSSSAYYARWYGPYYTASGTVYHPNGTQTQRDMSSGPLRPMQVYDRNGTPTQSFTNATPRAAMVEEATVRRSALGGGRSMGLTMRSAAVSRACWSSCSKPASTRPPAARARPRSRPARSA